MFDELPRPLLFAHRGASLHAPENTLPAFELGARSGADVLELDVHLTKDGKIVVIHDATLERTTNGRGRVSQHDLAAIRGLDAGYRFRATSGYPFRDKGVTVPLLEEVLGAFPRHGINIELKMPMVPELLRLLAGQRRDRLLLTAANDAVMADLEREAKGFALGMSYSQARAVWRGAYFGRLDERWRGRALQIPLWSGWRPVATRRVVGAARRAGMEVHLWTINSPRVAHALLRRGCDGIMSDAAGELYGVFADFRDSVTRR
jgi:glycerophosphoryl diester phosphodiesterase